MTSTEHDQPQANLPAFLTPDRVVAAFNEWMRQYIESPSDFLAEFETVGRLPDAFRHPDLGFVDALVMYKDLTKED